jgi:phosphotransferase system HPr-like phosphotransfer protein
MLLLGAGQGAEIELIATGGNEEECLRQIAAIFTDGAGI